ncbi:M1 family metallopeptidase [Cellulomonas fimi]|uniref:Aminopeptidase N n=1 Tax=Cellulomonas fimi TaxID=1708 RepID=A0A7Y0QHB1_CELFI|nr:M1 family metallopeptidase [Cellulomonas fimi]NMR20941.1 M1 family metallopeptidase [Cellulomonas fimi]
MSAATALEPYQPNHGARDFHVEHYGLDLTYRVASHRLDGTATLSVVTLEPVDAIALDLHGLAVRKVAVSGASLARYSHRSGRLVLRLRETASAGARLTVTVTYAGAPVLVPSPWGPVGWEELTDGALCANQPTGAPSWFPCNDRPDDKATYRTSITVEKPYRAVAHGTLVSSRARAGATTWVYEQRAPTSTYLATVQVGQYDEVVLAEEPVRQVAVVPPTLAAAARTAFSSQGRMVTHFESLFGPYPFGEYTVVVTADELEIPLEAQGMAIFGANHLLPGSDDERLVPHELAHQWFGNAVSVASWQHIWLNEGPACYAEWLWSEESGGPTADELARLWHARLRRRPQDLVLADPGYERIFDDRIYKRGALTLHAVRGALGDAGFFDLLRSWTARHAGGVVTTEDFRAHTVDAAGGVGGDVLVVKVTSQLRAWLDMPRLPALLA